MECHAKSNRLSFKAFVRTSVFVRRSPTLTLPHEKEGLEISMVSTIPSLMDHVSSVQPHYGAPTLNTESESRCNLSIFQIYKSEQLLSSLAHMCHIMGSVPRIVSALGLPHRSRSRCAVAKGSSLSYGPFNCLLFTLNEPRFCILIWPVSSH